MADADRRKRTRYGARQLDDGATRFSVEFADGLSLTCSLVNISGSGLRAYCSHMPATCATLESRELVFCRFAMSGLAFLEGSTGMVSWCNDDATELGLVFHEPFGDEVVLSLLGG